MKQPANILQSGFINPPNICLQPLFEESSSPKKGKGSGGKKKKGKKARKGKKGRKGKKETKEQRAKRFQKEKEQEEREEKREQEKTRKAAYSTAKKAPIQCPDIVNLSYIS